MRKLTAVFIILIMAFSLCGCDIFTTDTAELLSPPALTGDMYPIDKALKESIDTDYTLEYPSRGDYRSAIIQHDVNKDGLLEAFAFYRTTDDNSTKMNINAVVTRNGGWQSAATQSIEAGGVDRIDFCDLDRDGTDEILIGWEIYGTSELQLAIYSLGENTLTQRMLEKYTHYVTCDLDDDDTNEILIVRANPAESMNTAHLYTLTSVGVSQIASCLLDSTAKTLNHPVAAPLSTGKNAIYIDEIKGVGAVTEVLFLEKGQLVNPLYNPDAKETSQTLRSASYETYDINSDGIPEIPIQKEIPTVTKTGYSQKQYLTEWCSFNGETLTNQISALVNSADGYYYVLPLKLANKIAVLKDSENSLMEIYHYDQKKKVSKERLVYFKAVKKIDWDAGIYSSLDMKEIVNNGETTYVCYFSAAAEKYGITLDKIKNDFKLLS